MNEDIVTRGARIFQDVNNAFKKDPEINEYGIIPVVGTELNRCPVVLTQHKLGLESWSVPVLYQYAYQLHFTPSTNTDPDHVNNISRTILLINAECSTVWNFRKKLILSDAIDLIKELSLTSLILRKHPKSPETFNQRKWLLRMIANSIQQKMGGERIPPTMTLAKLIKQEMVVCRKAAESHACNYNAWSHRIWTIQNYHDTSNSQFLHDELKDTEEWVWIHISDHSGFHYRQFLLQFLKSSLSPTSSISNLYCDELDLTHKMIKLYPDHEAIWYHRRFIVHSMLKLVQQKVESEQSKKTRLEFSKESLLGDELELAARYCDRSSNNYQRWLNNISTVT